MFQSYKRSQILPYSFCEEPQTSKPKYEIYTLQFLFDKNLSQRGTQNKCTSRIWKSVVIGLRKFRLISADACVGGTRDQALRVSAWEANSKEDSEPYALCRS